MLRQRTGNAGAPREKEPTRTVTNRLDPGVNGANSTRPIPEAGDRTLAFPYLSPPPSRPPASNPLSPLPDPSVH